MALNRLNKELSDISKNPPPGISAGPINDDMFNWQGVISGPEGSPYAGGLFCVRIRFPEDYPFKRPEVYFTTKIYHPNINSNGSTCACHMRLQWSHTSNISNMLLNISALLTSPNLDCRLSVDVANLYESNRTKYNETAKEWTRKYAM